MNKPIIIDGVDVSECIRFDKDNNQKKVFDCYEIECFPNFCKGDNCSFKQLQRLKAENKRLKEENKRLRKECMQMVDDNYASTDWRELEKLKAENKRLSELTCVNCGEKFLSPTGTELYEENVQLKAENEELKKELKQCQN